MSQSYLEKLVSTNYKWKVLKRKKPPKWWLISSYKIVLQVWSGGLFTDTEDENTALYTVNNLDRSSKDKFKDKIKSLVGEDTIKSIKSIIKK